MSRPRAIPGAVLRHRFRFAGILVASLLLCNVSAAWAAAPIAADDGLRSEIVRLTASDGANGDQFGQDVAIQGDTAVVGADQDNNANGTGAGAAYVFTRDARGRWTEVQKLIGSDTAGYDTFGSSVAISGDTIVIGAAYAGGAALKSGAAYVFTRGGSGVWTQQAKLVAAFGQAYDFFGSSVAIANDTIVVGAPQSASNPYGAVYTFRRSGATWSQTDRMICPDASTGSGPYFGNDVAFDGVTLAVQAPYVLDAHTIYLFTPNAVGGWDYSGTKLTAWNAYGSRGIGVSGDTAIGSGLDSGQAALGRRSATGIWAASTPLLAYDGEGSFGLSSAVWGDSIVVTGMDEPAFNGSAYFFHRNPQGTWVADPPKVTGVEPAGFFGWSTAIYDHTVLIGADQHQTPLKGYVSVYNDGYFATEDTPLVVPGTRGVLADDFDADGDTLTPSLADTSNLHGTLVFDADGGFTYTPEADFAGTATATYRDWDGTAFSAPAVIAITVDSVNDAPVARDDTVTVAAGARASFNVLANDTDVDTSHAALTATDFSAPSVGTLESSGSGEVTFTPPAKWAGTVTFTYRVFDGERYSGPATAAITVLERPTGLRVSKKADRVIVLPGDAVRYTLTLANGSHVNAGMVTVADTFNPRQLTLTDDDVAHLAAIGGRVSAGRIEIATSLKPGAAHSVSYTMHVAPVSAFKTDSSVGNHVTVDSPTVQGGSDDAWVTVRAYVLPPVARANGYRCYAGSELQVSAPGVLGNDSLGDGRHLEASVKSSPLHAARFALNADGSFTYVPDPGFVGTDSFAYYAFDGFGSASAWVTIRVVPDPSEEGTPTPAVAATSTIAATGTPSTEATTASPGGGSGRNRSGGAAKTDLMTEMGRMLAELGLPATVISAVPWCVGIFAVLMALIGVLASRRNRRSDDDSLHDDE